MRIGDLFGMALQNLRRRKGRTALTVIGVVVGTCAIVMMISLGIAMNVQNETMLKQMGDLTKIDVYGGRMTSTKAVLDDKMVQSIRGQAHVITASPSVSPSFTAVVAAGRRDRYQMQAYSVTAVMEDSLTAMGVTVSSGELLTSGAHYEKNTIPVLIGEKMAYQFEDTRRKAGSPRRTRYADQTDAMGQPVPPFLDPQKEKLTLVLSNGDGKETKRYSLVVVGVMNSNLGIGYYTENGIVMRLSDLKKLEKDYQKLSKVKRPDTGYDQVFVKVDAIDDVTPVEQWIKDQGFSTYSMTQTRKQMQDSVAKSQMILGGLAAISLLVAALNIANTMTMAIYERTKEIGVMKVLGCTLGGIRAMFLIESAAIGFIGGAAGSALSLALSAGLNHITELMAFLGLEGKVDLSGLSQMMGGASGGSGPISIVPFWLIAFALGFATLVGLASGIAPANRAVRISSLEAIRQG